MYRPLGIKIVICSIELNRVMLDVLNYMRAIVVDLKYAYCHIV